jgi:hypothetical protein
LKKGGEKMGVKEAVTKTAEYAAYVFVGLLIYDGAKHVAKKAIEEFGKAYARPIDQKIIEEAVKKAMKEYMERR